MRRASIHRTVLALTLAACGADASGAPSPPAAPPAHTSAATTPSPPGAGADPTIGRADATGTLRAVHIASRVGTTGPADTTPKRALAKDGVTLFAVLDIEVDGRRTLYSDAPSLRWKGALVTPVPLARAPRIALAWQRIEPAVADLSNTRSGAFRYEAIPYQATAIAATGGAIAADVRPTLTPDHGHGLGTMRYQLVARQGDRTIASPGVDARRGRGSGGLSDDVHRVSLRADDTFLGLLGEMYGQPYIWASAGATDRTHQSERLEGSDCADLMVYGARRLGLAIPYGWTGSLEQHARVLGAGALADDGIYRDARGRAVAFTRPGDLVLFPRHVGALVEDRGTIGVLDDDDLMLHTLFDSPKTQPIADSGYADNPIKVLRWKQLR
ncbi:MAG TPA: hypothetical protein VM734_01400 [Kofleriaceae bacterium]|jgi:cell wall-associated NlpC family hydrolase|nr:hypothetical protein [Kofleriaceae bacterium]